MTLSQSAAIQRMRDFGIPEWEIGRIQSLAKRKRVGGISRAGRGVYETTLRQWLESGKPELRLKREGHRQRVSHGIAFAARNLGIQVKAKARNGVVVVTRISC